MYQKIPNKEKKINEINEVNGMRKTINYLHCLISEGVLDLRVVPIPLYLSMLRLAEITGIKNQSQEKWNRYTSELTDLVTQSVEFDLTYGNKGEFQFNNILENSSVLVHIRTYIFGYLVYIIKHSYKSISTTRSRATSFEPGYGQR